MSSDPVRSRYQKSGGKWEPMGSHARGCLRMWTSAVVTTDGDIVPCCFDKFAAHSMGNLIDLIFSLIWYVYKYKSFRVSLIRNRSSIDIFLGSPLFFRI